MPILAEKSVAVFFAERVDEALRLRQIETTDGTEQYLIALLSEYAHPAAQTDPTFEKPMAFLLDEALHIANLADRFERLRLLGDRILYAGGFFPDHFETRGVDTKYLIGLGSIAYGNAESMLRTGGGEKKKGTADIFRELVEKFAVFVDVFTDVAEATMSLGSSTPKQVLRLYERWLKTGNTRLAQALAAHGLIPLQGEKGVVQ